METTLVDSNVILDIVTEDPDWLDWSAAALARQADAGALVINPVVYAEVAARFVRIEDLDAALPEDYYQRQALPWEAAFLAGRSFVRYRRRGGQRRSRLPDFYIGAHALVGGLTLLTRDARRYRSYFPRLRIVAPSLLDLRLPMEFQHGRGENAREHLEAFRAWLDQLKGTCLAWGRD